MGPLDPASYHPDRSLPARVSRHLTQMKAAIPLPKTPEKPIVSFTFDDFPVSAATNGARALETFNAHGTYYVCSGLENHTGMLGPMFNRDCVSTLIEQGHHVAAHSHAHIDCAVSSNSAILADFANNQAILRELGAPDQSRHYAWPFGETQFSAKIGLADQAITARGTQAGINRKGSDLMQLRAYGVTRDEWSVERVEHAIDKLERAPGWLIIFTHDVRNNPSSLGTTEATIKYLAERALKAGADILSVDEAYCALRTQMSLPA